MFFSDVAAIAEEQWVPLGIPESDLFLFFLLDLEVVVVLEGIEIAANTLLLAEDFLSVVVVYGVWIVVVDA